MVGHWTFPSFALRPPKTVRLRPLRHGAPDHVGVAYAFAAAVAIIPVPAQLVHRILLPDDLPFTFPVRWHFLQLCEEVIDFSYAILNC
jgi:hypothetical protein